MKVETNEKGFLTVKIETLAENQILLNSLQSYLLHYLGSNENHIQLIERMYQKCVDEWNKDS